MRRLVLNLRALAGLTALETMRQPIALLLLLTMAALMAVLPVVTSHTLGETPRMMADAALALHLVLGMLFGGFAACHTLTTEIRRGTAATVLSKPVSREVFFVAKLLGLTVIVATFSLVATLAGLVAVRAVAEPYAVDLVAVGLWMASVVCALAIGGAVNFFTRRPFVSDAYRLVVLASVAAFALIGALDREGRWQSWGAGYPGQLAVASALLAMAVIVLTGLSLALATRLEVVPTVTVCGVVLLVGMMSDYLLGRAAATSRWAAIAYAVMPNWQHFWMADALHLEEPIPWRYVGMAAGYALCYWVAVSALGVALFRHTEVKT